MGNNLHEELLFVEIEYEASLGYMIITLLGHIGIIVSSIFLCFNTVLSFKFFKDIDYLAD